MQNREPQSPQRRQRHRLGERRGAVLILVGLGLVVFLGMAAIAIDLGLLYVARGEAQRAADAAAHAGAGFYQLNRNLPDSDQRTRDFVVEFARNNTVRGLEVEVDGNDDIDIVPAESLIRVRVRRTEEAGGPIRTLFAGVLGFPEAGVSASAAAQIFVADRATCMLPMAIPDRWGTTDGSGQPAFPDWGDPIQPDDVYVIDEGQSPPDPVTNTGYVLDTTIEENDVGGQIILRPDGLNSDDRFAPSWWGFVWSDEYNFSGTGNPDIRGAISGCQGDPIPIGTSLQQTPGDRSEGLGPFFERLILDDLSEDDLVWYDPENSGGCVARRGEFECFEDENPRVRTIALFNPIDPAGNGTPITNQSPIRIHRFAGIFIEDYSRDGGKYQVYARLIPITGLAPGDVVAGPGDTFTAIRLVE